MKTYAYAAFAAVLLFAALVVGLVVWVLPGGGLAGPGADPFGDPQAAAPARPEPPPPPGDDGPAGRTPSRSPPGEDADDPLGGKTPLEAAGGEAPEEPEGPLPLASGSAGLGIRCSDAAGDPVPDALVLLRSGRSEERRATDGTGEAYFPEIAPGVYSYLIDSQGRPVLASAAPVRLEEGEEKQVEVTLGDFSLSITGRVLTESGRPVPDIEIAALPYLARTREDAVVPWEAEENRTVSGPEGHYEIVGLQSGEYELRTAGTERYPSVKTVVRAGVEAADLVLVESRTLSLFGRVSSPDGAPLADVLVMPVGQAGRNTRTDAEGLYELEMRLEGDRKVHTLRFIREGYQEVHEQLRRQDVGDAREAQLDVEMLPVKGLAEVSGVLRGAHGAPVVGETIHLHSQLVKSRYQAVSGEDGGFVIPEVQTAVDYRLWIRPKGPWQDHTESSIHVPAEGVHLQVVLDPLESGTLRGRMVDAEGRPVPRFGLWLRSTAAAGKAVEVTGDDQGTFQLEDVPEGRLIFETRSMPRLTISGLRLEPGEDKEVELVVDWGEHEIDGRVVDSRGGPVAGAQVYLSWFHREDGVRSGSTRRATTDDRGTFHFTQLGPGVHRLNVSAKGYRSAQASRDVGSGKGMVEVRLEDAPR